MIEFLSGLAAGGAAAGLGCLALWRRLKAAEMRMAAAEAARGEFAVRANLERSEREAADEAVRRLEAAFDALPLPMWRRDGEQQLVWCNRTYAAAADIPRDEILAGRIGLGGIALANRLKRLARLALAARTAQSESDHIVVAGVRRLFDFTEVPLPDGGTIGIAVDQTERDDASIELARHIAAQGAVLETMPVAIGIFGADRRLKYFNSAYARLWRADEAWLAGEPEYGEIMETLRERRRLPEFADFRLFKRQRLGLFDTLFESFDELMYLPDGTTLRERCMPHPLGGLLFAFEDVTDRLVLERSYNTLIAVQRATLDNLYEGVAVFGSDGRLKLHNPAFARVWDIPDAALVAEPHIGDVVERMRPYYGPQADWPALKERIVESLTARDGTRARIARSDARVLDYAVVPLPDGATQLSFVDVTDRLRVEQALRERAEALEAADRLKSEFISTVSYELRTPLNTIIGFTELLSNQYFGTLNTRQCEYCSDILTASERLLAIVNDILDLASIDAGRMTLELDAVDPLSLLSDTVEIMGDLAREREIALAIGPCTEAPVRGDERRLKQAMCNLVSNALKFTPSGGRVTLSAARDGDSVLFVVADTGVGIAKSDLARVFKEFERGNDAETRRMGAGLGLSLVKRIVELHGGSIALHSETGVGTVVTCRLACWEGAAA